MQQIAAYLQIVGDRRLRRVFMKIEKGLRETKNLRVLRSGDVIGLKTAILNLYGVKLRSLGGVAEW
jgi:hypothetical protein